MLKLLWVSFFIYSFLLPKKSITNCLRPDGFGAQYQCIVYHILYSGVNNLNFIYTPVQSMAYDYTDKYNFLDRLEDFIGIKNEFPVIKGENRAAYNVNKERVYTFIHSNIDMCYKSRAMKQIKKIFWKGKSRNFFKNNKFNVAVHVRRPNKYNNRANGSDTPDEYYFNLMNFIREDYRDKDLLFHIYSQGSLEDFESYKACDVQLHIDEDIFSTFTGMVSADVLVLSASSLSYIAGWLSDGVVYYKTFWHPPLKHWKIVDA